MAVLVLWIVWHATSRPQVWSLLQGIFLMIPVIGASTIIFVFWNKVRILDLERVNFISSVSHELLTPLASLRLYIETMMMRELDEEKREAFLRLMLEDSQRLGDSIAGVLAASRIDRGKAVYHPEENDMADLIEVFLASRPQMVEKIKLRLDLAPGCLAMIDPNAFDAVLKNLIENSIRYSSGKPSISISLRGEEKKIHLTLSDDGDGIEKKQLKKIFTEFHRASGKQGGTGLGLYIVKSSIKAHKGKVWAESPGPGHGSSFHIILPKAPGGQKE